MKNENIVFRSFRMNMDNPQHVKVNEILSNIDKDVCKSKNQFVIDAIEFYVDQYGKETFTKNEEGTRHYIRIEDLEKIKKEIEEAVLTESRREVIRILGTAVSGRGIYQTGKVLLTENLDSMLANGQISQQEYNEYYPYDGAGYYSVFVDSNMAEARSVSGTTQFNSEDDIAQYIADMLVLENGPYFLIEYAGTYDYYGKTCYEFRCYRA